MSGEEPSVKPSEGGDEQGAEAETETIDTLEIPVSSLRISVDEFLVADSLPRKDRYAPIVIQPPERLPVDGEDADIHATERLGLEILPPDEHGAVVLALTTVETEIAERFVGFHIGMIDDVIGALEHLRDLHAEEWGLPVEPEPGEFIFGEDEETDEGENDDG